MAGRVDFATNPLAAQIELAKAGKLRMLAVLGPNREASLPDVPTATEAGFPEMAFNNFWFGLFGPAKMPRDRVDFLANEANQLLKRPDIREKLEARSLKPESSTPDAFSAALWADFERWGKTVADLGLAAK